MALFLSNRNYSDSKIQLLGRWKSLAFMDYIRPQVMEWTNDLSKAMIETLDFADLGSNRTDTSIAHNPLTDGPNFFLHF